MTAFSDRLGQLLLIGFEGDACDRELAALLGEVRPGGVIFFQRNIASAEQFQALAGEIRSLLGDSLPFLAIDQEGGSVDRLREVIAPLPSARAVAQAGLAREFGQVAGRELAAFSLNVNFAPVLDLSLTEAENILGTRTVAASPEKVARFGGEFLAGLAGQGILGCGKHFPGLGRALKDTHQALPWIEAEEAELWETDLYPFRALAKELPMIMVAHSWFPALEKDRAPDAPKPLPASLSPRIVSGLLKERIGYRGLILSDDLEMGGVLEDRSLEQAAVAAIRAGCDALLVCRQATNVRNVFEALAREAERDTDFRAQVEQTARKISQIKQSLPKPERPSPDWKTLRQEIRKFAEMVQQRPGSSAGSEG